MLLTYDQKVDLKKWLYTKNISQRTIAENLGVNECQLSKWINGKATLPMKSLCRLSTCLPINKHKLKRSIIEFRKEMFK